MSVVFRIPVAGVLDGTTVPLITGAKQDSAGVYDVTYTSPGNDLGVIDVGALMLQALNNKVDDFLIPTVMLPVGGGGAGLLELARVLYEGGPDAGIRGDEQWNYLSDPGAVYGPAPFLVFTGQRLLVRSDAAPGDASIYLIVLPVAGKDLLEALCCTNVESSPAPPPN